MGELQRKMLMQANTRLAEDLKNEKKNVMIIKEKAHRKYKQLQIQMQAEQRQYKLKEKEMEQNLQKTVKKTKKDEFVISELQKKFSALQADYNMRINSGDPNAFKQENMVNNNQQQQINNSLINKIGALETNNKSLISNNEKYRRELSGLKRTILSCNDTMRQKQIRLLKSQRRMLIQEVKDLRDQNEKLKNIIVTGDASAKKPSYHGGGVGNVVKHGQYR